MLRMCIAFWKYFYRLQLVDYQRFFVVIGKVERVSIVPSMEDIISSSSIEIVAALATAKFVVTLAHM